MTPNGHFMHLSKLYILPPIEQTYDSGDEDLTTIKIGKLFLDSLSMLRAFESYCTRQVCCYENYFVL